MVMSREDMLFSGRGVWGEEFDIVTVLGCWMLGFDHLGFALK